MKNCFACISCIGSRFLPFLSLNFVKENIKLMAFCEIVYALVNYFKNLKDLKIYIYFCCTGR